jgi:hypothetical protein
MSIAFNAGFANNPNDTLGRKAVSAKTTGSSFRDYLATPGATAPEKPSPAIGSVASKAAEFDPVRSGHDFQPGGFALAMRGMSQGAVNIGVSDSQYNALQSKAAEFDPFSVVRSGAVPEDNAFVQALKRLYGLVDDPAPVPQIAGAVTLDATPVQTENVQANQANMVSPSMTDQSPDPMTGLSQLIANAVEQSAATTANQEVMDSVLNRLS